MTGQPILTAAAMRAAEAAAVAAGIPIAELMARAGHAVADQAARFAMRRPILVLAGPGNNGGDGYVAAAELRAAGHPVRVAAATESRTDLARAARARWTGPVEPLATATPAPILIDALFGTGLSRPLDAVHATHFHRLAAAARLTIAIDLPSGVTTDDGRVLTEPPRCHVTLALGAAKPSHLLQPAARYAGHVRLIDLGLSPASAATVIAKPAFRDPGPDSHKYSRGMVALVGGAMPGASELASLAALRAGVGYVLHLGDGEGPPHALVRRPWSADALTDPRIDAVVIGPGLGRDAAARARLSAALASGRPLVIDGDALHLLDPDAPRSAGTILTPHAGEFDALFGKSTAGKIDRARTAATRADAVIVFKGPDTVIAAPDGRVTVSANASDWLSAAGTGDVLAGATGAMLASGLPPFEAATAAVWLHREAARLCGRSFIADDLVGALSRVR